MWKFSGIHLEEHCWARLSLLVVSLWWRISVEIWDWVMETNATFLVCLEMGWALSTTVKGKTHNDDKR